MQVEVFKTNVADIFQSEKLVEILQEHFPGSNINFDLEDCDRILRIAEQAISADKVIELLALQGYYCEVLL